MMGTTVGATVPVPPPAEPTADTPTVETVSLDVEAAPYVAPGPLVREPPIDMSSWEVDVDDWRRLADCESGEWSADGEPRPDTRRWDYGLDFDHGDHFQGGLNFHPDTWETYRDPQMPAHAGRAGKWQEIEVAERVLDDQGWQAWPVCSRMVDLRD